MAIEIERKFLVCSESYKEMAQSCRYIRQGYLSRDPKRTVRIRTIDEHGFITVKGKTKGYSRLEFEYPIDVKDAEEMLALCDMPIIAKRRYIVYYQGYKWEIDEFLGDKAPLVLAEIELTHESQQPPIPPFIGQEVSGDIRYYNSNL